MGGVSIAQITLYYKVRPGEADGNHTLRATRYRLSFWVNDDAPQQSDAIDTAPTVDGHIDISGIGEAAVLSGPDSLTLTLADGREIAFRIRSTAGDTSDVLFSE